MPRNESYLLRLTKPEKDELARRAKEQGISIAKLIRQRLDLDAEAVTLPRPDYEEAVEVGRTYGREYEARVDELSRTMPRRNAERLARRELGT